MFYRIPFEVETGHQPLQNVASLTDKSNRVQRWFDFLNAYNSTLKHALGGLAATPEDVFFVRGGRNSVYAQKYGQYMRQAASKRFYKDVTSGVIKDSDETS